jgi:hypothetical protein
MSARDEERKLIVSLHEVTEGCPKLARETVQKTLGYHIGGTRVSRVWVEEGLQEDCRGGHRHGVSRDSFLQAYEMFKGDFQKIQNHLGRTPAQLVNLGYRYDVEFSNRPRIHGTKKKIGHLYGRVNTKGKQINTRGQNSFLN